MMHFIKKKNVHLIVITLIVHSNNVITHYWASMRENSTLLHAINKDSDQSAHPLFAYWIKQYLNLLPAKFQYSSKSLKLSSLV